MIERMVADKVNKALAGVTVVSGDTQVSQSKPKTQAPVKQVEAIDWSGMSNADLWTTK